MARYQHDEECVAPDSLEGYETQGCYRVAIELPNA